jgi:hypothetical protein
LWDNLLSRIVHFQRLGRKSVCYGKGKDNMLYRDFDVYIGKSLTLVFDERMRTLTYEKI